jgi:membrane fusion protein, multidrug efflux system
VAKKTWLVLAGVGVVVLAGAGGMAFKTGLIGGSAAAAPSAGKASDAKMAAQDGKKEGKKDGKDGDKKPDLPLEFAAREIVQPQMARLAAVVEFSGPLVAPQTAIVRAKAAGTLLALNVGEGARVGAGQVLGRIEQTELGSRVAERRAQLESARTTLAQAERTHANNERLAAQSFISSFALDNSRAAVETARAALNASQASLDAVQTGLRDGNIVSPIAGIVAKRHVLPGEKLSPEQQVFTIVDIARLELAGTVGTHEVGQLQPGMTVQIAVEGVEKPVPGQIARIAPAAEPGTRSIGVTVAVANPKEMLRAGQYGLAKATIADSAERLVLPISAVARASGQDHVWVLEKGSLARRAITLGRKDEREGKVEVLQGLTPAAQVLSARFENLREGAKALVVAEKTAPVASAAASTPASLK